MDFSDATGAPITGWDHVVQSIGTILATRVGTRVFRRAFGSDVPKMIDMPMNDAGLLGLYGAVAEAIETWEPRFALSDVGIEGSASGTVVLVLTGSYRPNAHLGDLTTVSDDVRSLSVSGGRAQIWSAVQ